MKGFEEIDREMDFRTSVKIITGRLTPLRFKIIHRFCRKMSWSSHCGHEWDCCGCQHAQSMSYQFINGQLKLTITQSFNY